MPGSRGQYRVIGIPVYPSLHWHPYRLPIESATTPTADRLRSSGDMPVRAVLDELVRLGSIAEIEEGKLELVDRGFIPSENMQAKVHILGTDGSELLETIIFNIEHGVGTSPRFQRKVMHTGIPLHAIPAFRELSSKKGQAMLELFDSWLAQRDLSAVEQKDWPASARVGVGIYYYEQLSAAAGVEK